MGRVIKVSTDVWRELERLRVELGLDSINEVVKYLLKSRVTHSSGGMGYPSIPYECSAKRVGKAYFITCSDGSQAFIPDKYIDELVSRFNIKVKVIS
jgi:hypothetical protein